MYRGGQTTPGATTWREWQTNLDTAVTDPVLVAAAGTDQRVFFRNADGNYFLWHVPAYSSTSLRAKASTQVVPVRVTKGTIPAGK